MACAVPVIGRSRGSQACGEAAWRSRREGLVAASEVVAGNANILTLPRKRAVEGSGTRSADHWGDAGSIVTDTRTTLEQYLLNFGNRLELLMKQTKGELYEK